MLYLLQATIWIQTAPLLTSQRKWIIRIGALGADIRRNTPARIRSWHARDALRFRDLCTIALLSVRCVEISIDTCLPHMLVYTLALYCSVLSHHLKGVQWVVTISWDENERGKATVPLVSGVLFIAATVSCDHDIKKLCSILRER